MNQNSLKHDRTLIDDRGNVLAAIGPNLLSEIQSARRRFLIDNNYPWREQLPDLNFVDCAFILGTTIQSEMDRSTAVLFDGVGKTIIARNYFLFSNDEDLNCWAFDRMDENHRYIYDQLGLQEGIKSDPPIGLRIVTEAQTSELREEARLVLDEIRRELIHQLKHPKGIVRQRLLIQEARNHRSSEFKDFFTALEIARRCHATLLINDKSARRDYLEKPVNSLEDSVLIGEALFLHCEILSRNSHIKEMGRYCQIPVHDKLS